MTTKRKKPVVLVGRVLEQDLKEFRRGWAMNIYPLKYTRKYIDIKVRITIEREL